MKKDIGKVNALYPMPTTIVGATVENRANFATIAFVGIFSYDIVSIGSGKNNFTNRGIKQNKTYSINIPSDDMVTETDYVGIVTGKKVDKSNLFKFSYGKLKTAPMIDKAPISMECELLEILDYGNHEIFISKVVNTYVDENILVNDKINIANAYPMLFDMHLKKYWKLGEGFAKCWDVGKNLKMKL